MPAQTQVAVESGYARDGSLTLRYGDPDLDRKIGLAGTVSTLIIHGLPHGVRLRQGVDDRGFYLWFDDGSDQLTRYFHPRGLREIKVNSQSIDVDLERKWLIESLLSRHNQNVGNFASLTHQSHLRELFSYYARLSQLSEAKLQFLSKVLHHALDESPNPYFRVYLTDVVMAQILKSLIVTRFKVRRAPLDQDDVVSLAEAVLSLLRNVTTDTSDTMESLGMTVDPEQFMPLSGDTLRINPQAFWAGIRYQAAQRHALLEKALPSIRAGNILELVTDSDLLLSLKDGQLARTDENQNSRPLGGGIARPVMWKG